MAEHEDTRFQTSIRAIQSIIRARLRRHIVDLSISSCDIDALTQEVFLALLNHDVRILRNWDVTRSLSWFNYVGLVAQRQALKLAALQTRGRLYPSSAQSHPSKQRLEKSIRQLTQQLTQLGLQLLVTQLIEQQSEMLDRAQTQPDLAAIHTWRTNLRNALRTMNSTHERQASGAPPSTRTQPLAEPFGSRGEEPLAEPFGSRGEEPFGSRGEEPFGSRSEEPFGSRSEEPFGSRGEVGRDRDRMPSHFNSDETLIFS